MNGHVKDCRFPYSCAVCGAETGMPILANNYKDQLRIIVQCSKCNEAWTLRFDNPPTFDSPQEPHLHKKRDRRQQPEKQPAV